MRTSKRWLAALTTTAMVGVAGTAQAEPITIEFWHGLGGASGEALEKIADGFNEKQDTYEIKTVYKGNYTETMTAAISAFRAQEHPAIVQVFEVGTATMMNAEGAIYPVHEMMDEQDVAFDEDDYIPAVASYYTTTEGDMLSMPFNSSTPVLWYNKDAFEAAGLDPNDPPETWSEAAEYSRQIMDAGYECGFSIGWQSWVAIENFSAWHNSPIGTKQNGFGGLDTELVFNNDLVTGHIADLREWQQDGIFQYGGRRGESLPMFTNGKCAMWLNSSAYYGGIKSQADFDFGQAFLPHYADVADAPQNSIIGGATLWVLRGKDSEQYQGVAQFFEYLTSPEVQFTWHKDTGYVPVTKAAYELAQEKGYYEENPGTDTAIKQLSLNEPTPNSKGLRFGNFVQIRDIINEELEAVWSGNKSAEEALDTAVERGNQLIRKFEQQNGS
jgi:sn-glycerol 3-phosphate transport system substrate-binding protein